MEEQHTPLEEVQKDRAERKLRGQAMVRYCQHCGNPGAGWTALSEDGELYVACTAHFHAGPPKKVAYDFKTGEAVA